MGVVVEKKAWCGSRSPEARTKLLPRLVLASWSRSTPWVVWVAPADLNQGKLWEKEKLGTELVVGTENPNLNLLLLSVTVINRLHNSNRRYRESREPGRDSGPRTGTSISSEASATAPPIA
uniref:Uncharacterized protein n=1 Tax=Fagus sylvatica TaxID=28930 RepID=A0A2N9G0B7_FAGSY